MLLDNGGVSVSATTKEAHRILSLYPAFPNDVGRTSFFHELGINEECCSFNKGCYVGQEVINRMDVKGILTKKLQLYRSQQELSVGMKCSFSNRTVGTLSSVCQLDGTWYGMGIIRKAAWGQPLEIGSLRIEPVTDTEV